MSGKGSKSGKGNNSSGRTSDAEPEPTIVSGWEYHMYAQKSPDRYVYIGKGDDGEPEFLDYGPKKGKR